MSDDSANPTSNHQGPWDRICAWLNGSAWRVFAVYALILLLVNFKGLLDPPYWDAITGPFTEGRWLKNHGFNFVALWQQPYYEHGGANIYGHSLYSLLCGVLMLLLPPKAMFFVLHLVSILCAAGTAALSYRLAKALLPNGAVWLWLVAAAVNPIWSGQTLSINMELPIALAVVAAFVAANQKRWAWVFGYCCLGLMIKESVIVLALALVTWLLCRWVHYRTILKMPTPLTMTEKAMLAAPLLGYLGLKFFAPSSNITRARETLEGFGYLWLHTQYFFPDLMLLIAIALPLLMAFAWRLLHTREQDPEQLHRFHIILLIATFIYGFWASYLHFQIPLPRYAAFAIFPTALLLGSLLPFRFSRGVAICAIIWGLLNQHGALLPPLPDTVNRSGDYLERSRGYRQDLLANMKLCDELATQYRDWKIVARYPWLQMLTMPEAGYVDQALPSVYAAHTLPSYVDVKDGTTLDPNASDVLYLYTPNSIQASVGPDLAPQPGDVAVLQNEVDGGRVIVYRHPTAAEKALYQQRMQQ